MKWTEVQKESPSNFKRLVGVTPSTFRAMVKEIKRDGRRKKKVKAKKGRPFKLSVEDQVLMTLMYWREYRTFFHTGRDYGISESVVCRTIQRIENKLSRSDKFKLPGKKQLAKTSWKYEVILVDATEGPIERPKKNSTGITQAKRKGTR
jgi:hypothetical protein